MFVLKDFSGSYREGEEVTKNHNFFFNERNKKKEKGVDRKKTIFLNGRLGKIFL